MSRLSDAYDRFLDAKKAYEEAREEVLRLASQPEAAAPEFKTLDELNAALDRQRREQVKKQVKTKVDPQQRIRDIESELDIIRGTVPTPTGYTVDRSRVKSLVKEPEQLRAEVEAI